MPLHSSLRNRARLFLKEKSMGMRLARSLSGSWKSSGCEGSCPGERGEWPGQVCGIRDGKSRWVREIFRKVRRTCMTWKVQERQGSRITPGFLTFAEGWGPDGVSFNFCDLKNSKGKKEYVMTTC